MLKVGWEAIIDVRWKYFAKNGCGCRVRKKGSGREEKGRYRDAALGTVAAGDEGGIEVVRQV